VIILDTNVLSGIMQDEPDLRVAQWLDRQAVESSWTTAVNVYELRFGIELLASGRKRRNLGAALDRLLRNLLEGRILSFDRAAAEVAGQISAKQRRAGRPVEVRDVQIAGIALARRATLVTRNVPHFSGVGLTLVNPWAA
jgi:predicted nucleic acid-binding protein